MSRNFKCFANQNVVSTFLSALDSDLENTVDVSLDCSFDVLINLINCQLDRFAPCKVSVPKKKKNWVRSKELRNAIRKRDKFFRKLILSPSEELRTKYCQIRNKVTNLMKSKEKEFYTKRVSQALNSPSKFFLLFNSLLGKNVKPSNPVKLCQDGKLVDDPLQVSEVLNEYFVSIGPSLSANFSDCDQDDVLEQSFSAWLRPTNAEEIGQIVMSLSDSKGVGCDGNNNKSLKIVLPVILDRLVIMINGCIKNGLFPSSLKKAKVVPLPKSGSSDEIDNFRPISVLTGLSKVLEKIIYARLMDHLITNDLLYSKHFGFRPKFSCVDAIAELTENIKSSSSLQLFACIFLDLKKSV